MTKRYRFLTQRDFKFNDGGKTLHFRAGQGFFLDMTPDQLIPFMCALVVGTADGSRNRFSQSLTPKETDRTLRMALRLAELTHVDGQPFFTNWDVAARPATSPTASTMPAQALVQLHVHQVPTVKAPAPKASTSSRFIQ